MRIRSPRGHMIQIETHTALNRYRYLKAIEMPLKIPCVDDSIHLAKCRCEVGAIIASFVSTECPNVDTTFFSFQMWWSFTHLTTHVNSTFPFQVKNCWCFPTYIKLFFDAIISWRDVWKLSPNIFVKSLNSQEAWLDFKLGGGFKYYYLSPTWWNQQHIAPEKKLLKHLPKDKESMNHLQISLFHWLVRHDMVTKGNGQIFWRNLRLVCADGASCWISWSN